MSGISASMSQNGRDLFNEWVKTILEKYPENGTVSRIEILQIPTLYVEKYSF